MNPPNVLVCRFPKQWKHFQSLCPQWKLDLISDNKATLELRFCIPACVEKTDICKIVCQFLNERLTIENGDSLKVINDYSYFFSYNGRAVTCTQYRCIFQFNFKFGLYHTIFHSNNGQFNYDINKDSGTDELKLKIYFNFNKVKQNDTNYQQLYSWLHECKNIEIDSMFPKLVAIDKNRHDNRKAIEKLKRYDKICMKQNYQNVVIGWNSFMIYYENARTAIESISEKMFENENDNNNGIDAFCGTLIDIVFAYIGYVGYDAYFNKRMEMCDSDNINKNNRINGNSIVDARSWSYTLGFNKNSDNIDIAYYYHGYNNKNVLCHGSIIMNNKPNVIESCVFKIGYKAFYRGHSSYDLYQSGWDMYSDYYDSRAPCHFTTGMYHSFGLNLADTRTFFKNYDHFNKKYSKFRAWCLNRDIANCLKKEWKRLENHCAYSSSYQDFEMIYDKINNNNNNQINNYNNYCQNENLSILFENNQCDKSNVFDNKYHSMKVNKKCKNKKRNKTRKWTKTQYYDKKENRKTKHLRKQKFKINWKKQDIY